MYAWNKNDRVQINVLPIQQIYAQKYVINQVRYVSLGR
jgi:hypothetical protein